jgi:uncharacterized membrane protein YdfJ with MMPL/SSD domain
MSDKIKHLKSIDKQINSVTKIVKNYEKQPTHQKLPQQYDDITQKIKGIKMNIEEFINIIEEPDQYEDPDSIDLEDINEHDKFSIHLSEIEEIRNTLNNNTNLSLYREAELYLKLHSLVKLCNDYIEGQKLEIISV